MSWAFQWGTTIMSEHSWRKELRSTRSCWTRFRVKDMQSAWLLLSFCAATRANFLLRSVRPELTDEFASCHYENVTKCLAEILEAISSWSLPLASGGLGVGGAWRIRGAVHWESWADFLEMI